MKTEAKTKESNNFFSCKRKHVNKTPEIWRSLFNNMDKSLSAAATHRLQTPACNFTKTRVSLQVLSFVNNKFFKNNLFVELFG